MQYAAIRIPHTTVTINNVSLPDIKVSSKGDLRMVN